MWQGRGVLRFAFIPNLEKCLLTHCVHIQVKMITIQDVCLERTVDYLLHSDNKYFLSTNFLLSIGGTT